MRLNEIEKHGVRIFGDQSYRGECAQESMEQVTFFSRLRRTHPTTWGMIAIHPRNEAMRTGGQIRAMTKHKAEGMTTGASDIIIPGRISFVCEMKRRDHTKSRFQKGQPEYLIAAHNAGAATCVALGADAAWEAFEEWARYVAR